MRDMQPQSSSRPDVPRRSRIGRGVTRRSVLSTGAIAASVVSAACVGTSGTSEPVAKPPRERVNLVFAGWGTPVQIESAEAEAAAFNRKYVDENIHVTTQFQAFGGYHDKLQVQAAGGDLPDVNFVSGSFFTNIALQGAFYDTGKFFQRDKLTWDNLPAGTRNFITIDGKVFGLPMTGFGPASAMVTVNKDLFQRAGLPVPGPGYKWTWDEVPKMAQTLTRPGAGEADGHWGVDFGKTTFEGAWQTMLRAYGGDLWNANRTESTINSEAAKTVFQYFKDLSDRWQVSRPPEAPGFDEGRVAMSIVWPSAASTRLTKLDFPIGVAATPRGPSGFGIATPTGANHTYQIAAGAKHPEEAWRLVKFLVTEKEAIEARSFQSTASVAWKPLIPVYAAKVPQQLQEWWKVGEFFIENTPSPAPLPAEVAKRVLPAFSDWKAILDEHLVRFYSGQLGLVAMVNELKRLLDARLRDVQTAAAK